MFRELYALYCFSKATPSGFQGIPRSFCCMPDFCCCSSFGQWWYCCTLTTVLLWTPPTAFLSYNEKVTGLCRSSNKYDTSNLSIMLCWMGSGETLRTTQCITGHAALYRWGPAQSYITVLESCWRCPCLKSTFWLKRVRHGSMFNDVTQCLR